jgi:hypothetical protein
MTPQPENSVKPAPRLFAYGPDGELVSVGIGPGLDLVQNEEGKLFLRAPRPTTATCVGLEAKRLDTGEFLIPEAIKGAIPKQITGLAVYVAGARMRAKVDYNVLAGEKGAVLIVPIVNAEPFPIVDLITWSDGGVIVDYVAHYS